MQMDPSLEALLRDVDVSLKNFKGHNKPPRALEVIPESSSAPEVLADEWTSMELLPEEDTHDDLEQGHRKSPAAKFGSNQIGSVALPLELQHSINLLISSLNKSELRSDALRLFQNAESQDGELTHWDSSYDTKYKSRKQAAAHGARDGSAFATVALPAHYAAIMAVLHHIKTRVDPAWTPKNVIDWGSATGSGLWASLHAFQQSTGPADVTSPTANNSTIKSYIGIDKREGLINIGKTLVNNTPTNNLRVQWQKSFKEENIFISDETDKSIALSAFMLTSLPTALQQKAMVEEMWKSGAQTIVLIDHNSKQGFEAIARAREHILGLGQAELEDLDTQDRHIRGAHVLAPCPHDRPCPLLHSGGAPLVCGFSQRIQRPSFVRLTKHSGVGHEDIGYSYVVIRRGPRPLPVNSMVGRVGTIGKRASDKARLANAPLKELHVYSEGDAAQLLVPEQQETNISVTEKVLTPTEVEEQLRQEAYHWPRLVFPPLKKSGHIILDSCTAEGKIMRLTIPKSQGKQPFYDARKSSWGDLFPHAPKNKPLERYQPKDQGKSASGTGGDIGKRRDPYKNRERQDYATVAKNMRAERKLSKKQYARYNDDKAWETEL
ncbi:hypothetical protein CVT24_003094 [Panaeolus cyanescens]|uniref:Rsm22-domain-containing protein n=1 Tax=Panaeolus cyanescens TaxID=181874 RepID=A0A409W1U1_9AGAR|nr:hypothetical protein CVT24_003094 [Panaeolus cyanescens]